MQALIKTRQFWVVSIIAVVVLGSVWVVFSQTIRTNQLEGDTVITLQPAPIPGHPAPDFALRTLDGEILRLSSLQGEPVIVNFWATWCAPCRKEFPDFQAAYTDNADRLTIIGVNSTSADQEERIAPFVEELGVTFPIVLDEDGDTVEAYHVRGLPTTIFIDADGVVAEVFTGPINKAYIEARLADL